MQIKQVRATPVRVPITRPATFSRRQRMAVLATVVEVETDDGLVGLGETRGHWAAPIINQRFALLLHGMPVHDRDAAFETCIPSPFDYGFPERGGEVHASAPSEKKVRSCPEWR
jgi:L-alanine-DL-glutamate epimerase-like enolase superfamily enzyme